MPLVNLCVYGLSGTLLDRFFAEETSRCSQPLIAASSLDLRFGLVGAGAALGLWGRGWPVALERCPCQREPCVHLCPTPGVAAPQPYQSIDDFLASEHYVAQLEIPADEFAAAVRSSGAPSRGPFSLSCRLVIVEDAFLRVSLTSDANICATPGTVIAGVDQQHSLPSALVMTACGDIDGAATDPADTLVEWCGVLDVRPAAVCHAAGDAAVPPSAESSQEEMGVAADAATVSFASTSDQFSFLHNLPALPPRPARYDLERVPGVLSPVSPVARAETAACVRGAADGGIPPFCDCGREGCDAATAGEPGPLLALTFYANDPRLPYDQQAWESQLAADVREVVRRRARDAKEPLPITTVFQVTGVQPIPVEGSCWCSSNLPMPAPLEQQLREVKRKRTAAAASASSLPASPASHASSGVALSSPAASHHHSHRESPRRAPRSTVSPSAPAAVTAAPVGFLEKGWCVRPLRSNRPVLPDVGNVDDHGRPPLDSSRTQEMWTCLLNLRELEEYGIEVTIKVPYIVEGTVLHLKGTTVIFSGMLQSSTSGTVLLPVFCPAPESTSTTELSSLWVKLYVQYLLVFPLEGCSGARGALEVVRSRETQARLTVPTLIGHRGLGKTYTRSPAICGAAPLVMKCNENTIPAFEAAHRRGCAMVEFDVMLSADRVPVVVHDPVIELLALKRGGAGALHRPVEHAPVRAEVHKLSWSQLRDLHAQCCKTLGRVFPLKDVLAHHWEGLVRWTAKMRGGEDGAAAAAADAPLIGSALLRAEDFVDGVPSLRQVLERTPPSLRFNLEVKYPFQPRSDSNLFLQSDAFEVNGFVDAILRVVLEFAESGREITFSSFDPNICLALALKQSRYDVFFLSDTKELRDLKDYRSFYIEGAIQFAKAQHLAGISMNAGTLLSPEDEAVLGQIAETPLYGAAERGPVPVDFYSPVTNPAYDAASVPAFFGSHGRAVIAEMHRRHLRVWTWGGMNSYLYFTYVQAAKMRVDGVIGDRMPVFAPTS